MITQNNVNWEAINRMGLVSSLIKKAAQFERDQMINYTMLELMNISLDNMNNTEIQLLQLSLFETFNEKGWIV